LGGGSRESYYPFEEEISAPEPDVYQHEMPGGQYTNLRQQARNLGLNDRWQEVVRHMRPPIDWSETSSRSRRQQGGW
jgi:pyruvate carboxylase